MCIRDRYQAKAKVTAGLAEITALKVGFEDNMNQGTTPTITTIGGTATTSNCTIVVAGTPADGTGSMACTFVNAPAPVLGQSITITRSATGVWTCGTTVPADYAPKACEAAVAKV